MGSERRNEQDHESSRSHVAVSHTSLPSKKVLLNLVGTKFDFSTLILFIPYVAGHLDIPASKLSSITPEEQE
jgi:hypothetical protein